MELLHLLGKANFNFELFQGLRGSRWHFCNFWEGRQGRVQGTARGQSRGRIIMQGINVGPALPSPVGPPQVAKCPTTHFIQIQSIT